MNSRPKILITQWMPEEGRDFLKQYCDIEFCDSEKALDKQELIKRAQGKDGLIIFMTDTIDREVVEKCKSLRVISSFGKGYDNIDVEVCHENGIAVTINRQALTEDTADLAIGLALANSRNILIGDDDVRSKAVRGWHPKRHLGRRFNHATIGIVGFGEIGAAIAKRAKGFSMKTYYYDVKEDVTFDDAIRCKNLKDMFSICDFIFVTANLSVNSYHLLNEENLRYIKDGAYIVNVSRGSIVDEEAVEKLLSEKKISGYASDVFAYEDKMMEDCPDYISRGLLDKIEQTVFTPHLGTGTIEARRELSISTAMGLIAALKGEAKEQLVD